MKPRDHGFERLKAGDASSLVEPVATLGRVFAASNSEQPSLQPRPETLRITYTQTRRQPDSIERLQRHVGIVRAERSGLSETFKMLRNHVVQRMQADGHRIIAVTSPRPIECKSLTSANLALALAAGLDSSVLLIDGDLANRGLQRLFGLEGAAGLVEYLTQDRPLHDLLVNPGVERLVFLPAGVRSHRESAELLATRAAHHLMQEVRSRYSDRWIVVDLPALLESADAVAFLPYVDTTLFVVEDHRTLHADLEMATQLLAPFNLIGSVLGNRLGRRPLDAGAAVTPWYRRWFRRGGD